MPKTLAESLLRHWPDKEHVLDVVSTQAEAFTRPVLLAVHQPMKFTERDKDGNDLGEVEQEALLRRVLEDHPDGYRIVPLLGPPGVGKSHALRWLDARIRQLDDPDNPMYHIVRVQKGASLKVVLDEVALGLKGPAYEEFKKRIAEAQQGLGVGTLLWALAAELTQALDEALPPEWVDDDLKDAYAEWHEGLRAFLGDHVIRERFLDNRGKGPLAVLAKRIHEGLKPEELDEEKKTRHKFLATDFEDAVEAVGSQIHALSLPARQFLVSLDQESRKQCADLLNGALDPATSQLLVFRGGELFQLFVDVRRQLFRDGREWVLLLEDLTALAGIRRDLFNIIVRGKDDQDLEKGGELCTIRSVLATTEDVAGFQGAWDTLVSRAEKMYVMRNNQPDIEVQIARVVELVGAYLNAARIGRPKMKEAYERRTSDADSEWVPNFSSAEKDASVAATLNNFETSEQGYHLFPLNRAAIRQQLLSEHLTTDRGSLTYNPRTIIAELVRNTLNMRDEFVRGDFPSGLLGRDKLESETFALELGRRILEGTTHSDRERYSRLLSYWGDQPQNEGDAARLPGAVYEAFGLRPIDFGEPPPDSTSDPEPDPKPDPKPDPRPEANPWREVLTRWRRGEAKLPQKSAREIREAVSRAVLTGMPTGWPGLPYPSHTIRKRISDQWTFIPRAGTGTAEENKAAIVVCTEKDLQDDQRGAEVVLDLLAVLEIHSAKDKDPWAYEDRTEGATFRRYCAFVSRHQERAAEWLRANQTDVTSGDSSVPVLEGLLLSAALLGSWEGDESESEVPDRIANMFRPVKVEISGHDEWAKLLEAAKAFHTAAQKAFETSFCSYQGTRGDTPLAVDVSELLESVESVDVGKVKAPKKDTPLRIKINELRRQFRGALKKREERLAAWKKEAKVFLDPSFQQHLFELLSSAEAQNFHIDLEGESLSRPIRDGLAHLLAKDLGEIVKSLADLNTTPPGANKIAMLSSVNEEALSVAGDLSKAVEAFLAVAAPKAAQKLVMLQGADDRASLAELEKTVSGIEQTLDD